MAESSSTGSNFSVRPPRTRPHHSLLKIGSLRDFPQEDQGTVQQGVGRSRRHDPHPRLFEPLPLRGRQAQPALVGELEIPQAAQGGRVEHHFDPFAAETLDEGLHPAVVVHVSMGEDQGFDIRHVHAQGAGVLESPLFGEPEIKEHLPGFVVRRQADHGRKPMFGQDAYPVAEGILGAARCTMAVRRGRPCR
jgi:hypothetical protein